MNSYFLTRRLSSSLAADPVTQLQRAYPETQVRLRSLTAEEQRNCARWDRASAAARSLRPDLVWDTTTLQPEDYSTRFWRLMALINRIKRGCDRVGTA